MDANPSPTGDPIYDEDEAIAMLEALATDPDTEKAHAEADAILCRLLRGLSRGTVADAYESVRKWYS